MTHPLESSSAAFAGDPFAEPFTGDTSLIVPEGIDGLDALSGQASSQLTGQSDPLCAPPPLSYLSLSVFDINLEHCVQGRWLEVAKRCNSTTAVDTATALTVVTYHVLALLKLKMHDQAAAELGKLGNLEDGAYLSRNATGSTSLVPFALRVLKTEVPWRLGRQQECIDHLHHLLEWCAQQESEAAPAGNSSLARLWQRRHRDVLLRLVSKHCQLRQFVPALSLLNRLLSASAADAEAWVEAGLVQALLGDLAAAQGTLQHAEQLLTAGSTGGQAGGGDAGWRQRRQLLAHRNRGLLAFLQRDYRGVSGGFAALVQLLRSPRPAAC
jgi:tetratricopeptide (TPR) repeat protein